MLHHDSNLIPILFNNFWLAFHDLKILLCYLLTYYNSDSSRPKFAYSASSSLYNLPPWICTFLYFGKKDFFFWFKGGEMEKERVKVITGKKQVRRKLLVPRQTLHFITCFASIDADTYLSRSQSIRWLLHCYTHEITHQTTSERRSASPYHSHGSPSLTEPLFNFFSCHKSYK